MYSTMKPKDTKVLKDRELNQTGSKPDTVNCLLRNACTTANHYSGTQYCCTQRVLLILPLLQTKITSQTWPSGGKGVLFYKSNFQLMEGSIIMHVAELIYTKTSPLISVLNIRWGLLTSGSRAFWLNTTSSNAVVSSFSVNQQSTHIITMTTRSCSRR